MGAGLEHPAPAWVAPLQQLQEPAVPVVRGRYVRLVRHPTEIGGQRILAVEDRARELTARDHDALLSEARAHRVHGPELGSDVIGEIDPRLRLDDARVA